MFPQEIPGICELCRLSSLLATPVQGEAGERICYLPLEFANDIAGLTETEGRETCSKRLFLHLSRMMGQPNAG
jgi:hypothetical protein